MNMGHLFLLPQSWLSVSSPRYNTVSVGGGVGVGECFNALHFAIFVRVYRLYKTRKNSIDDRSPDTLWIPSLF